MSTAANVSTASEVAAWHAVSVDEVAKRLGTGIGKGLDAAEAANRLHKYGPNSRRQSQELPIADERLVRNVCVGYARDCQREHGDVRQLPLQKARVAGTKLHLVCIFRQ